MFIGSCFCFAKINLFRFVKVPISYGTSVSTVAQMLAFVLHKGKILGLNSETGCLVCDRMVLCIRSSHCRSYFKLEHNGYMSLFSNHPTIRYYVVGATENMVKATVNK